MEDPVPKEIKALSWVWRKLTMGRWAYNFLENLEMLSGLSISNKFLSKKKTEVDQFEQHPLGRPGSTHR